MNYHFLNLCCLEWLDDVAIEDFPNNTVYCDSVSLKLKLRMLGFNVRLRPGVSLCSAMNNDIGREGVLFLTPERMDQISNQFVLPNFSDPRKDELKEILSSLRESENLKTVYFGISSPKQNILASRLSSLLPDVDFYCIGYALTQINKSHHWAFKALVGSGFQWIYFLLQNPRRGIDKLLQTVTNFFSQRNSALLLRHGARFER